jgi:hypothetical protein
MYFELPHVKFFSSTLEVTLGPTPLTSPLRLFAAPIELIFVPASTNSARFQSAPIVDLVQYRANAWSDRKQCQRNGNQLTPDEN